MKEAGGKTVSVRLTAMQVKQFASLMTWPYTHTWSKLVVFGLVQLWRAREQPGLLVNILDDAEVKAAIAGPSPASDAGLRFLRTLKDDPMAIAKNDVSYARHPDADAPGSAKEPKPKVKHRKRKGVQP